VYHITHVADAARRGSFADGFADRDQLALDFKLPPARSARIDFPIAPD
jgi:hypothetical protein